ncbi:putative signal transduction protein with CBS and DRTGG domains [Alicyclobacillus hesperidum URH17-3-68]|nr:putative signal transduction protein with CBS and DRTGG domains [Alicyclobacillus hesperidum URH17-3-68]
MERAQPDSWPNNSVGRGSGSKLSPRTQKLHEIVSKKRDPLSATGGTLVAPVAHQFPGSESYPVITEKTNGRTGSDKPAVFFVVFKEVYAWSTVP